MLALNAIFSAGWSGAAAANALYRAYVTQPERDPIRRIDSLGHEALSAATTTRSNSGLGRRGMRLQQQQQNALSAAAAAVLPSPRRSKSRWCNVLAARCPLLPCCSHLIYNGTVGARCSRTEGSEVYNSERIGQQQPRRWICSVWAGKPRSTAAWTERQAPSRKQPLENRARSIEDQVATDDRAMRLTSSTPSVTSCRLYVCTFWLNSVFISPKSLSNINDWL